MKVVVVGSGFGGLSAAGFLARQGHSVTVLEKNEWVGGRARVLQRDGFTLDMGPSWYWMPAEHDAWFTRLGFDRRDYYDIHRVDPSYRVYFGDAVPDEPRNIVDMPADAAAARAVFERYEPGAGAMLDRYLADCRSKYEFAMSSFIYKNYYSIFDFANWTAISNLPRINLFQSYGGRVHRRFRHPYLRRMLEFPVVFLGSRPDATPAVYTLMNHIDFGLGTWYPDGGFGTVVRSMQRVDEALGVEFRFGHEVTGFRFDESGGRGRIVACQAETTHGQQVEIAADLVVANADYPHVELELLPERYRTISQRSWDRASLAPGVLNFYLGFNRPLDEFAHHTFFFDSDWERHFTAVYRRPEWIDDPLFYLHVPSRTDPNCAPPGHEAVFLLIPVAPGLEDTPERRTRYLDRALERMEMRTGTDLRRHLVFSESMSISDFQRDYNAFRGNAFGLGQTLFQTAWFRSANRSKRVSNLYFAGQYTVPGTGTTMSMISGEVVADRIATEHPALAGDRVGQ